VAEARFQIIKEGLSNILRHTSAKNAFVSFQSIESNLLIDIGNEAPDMGSIIDVFRPKSICERALSMKGTVKIATNAEGFTVVSVTIPISQD
jgi:signal transduction histidine kinase